VQRVIAIKKKEERGVLKLNNNTHTHTHGHLPTNYCYTQQQRHNAGQVRGKQRYQALIAPSVALSRVVRRRELRVTAECRAKYAHGINQPPR
jgi:hypothetical protein